MIELIFLVLAFILFFGFLGEVIFEKTKIPDVIWLLIIGIALSTLLKLVNPEALNQAAPLFTTFALIFLLFEAGLNIDLIKFIKSTPQGFKLSFLSFIFSFIIIFLIGLVIGRGFQLSMLLGAILSGVSSAVVVPIINNVRVSSETRLSMIFDSAVSDVFCILATVTLIEIFVIGTVSAGDIVGGVISSFLIAIVTGAVAGFIWAKVVSWIVKKKGSFYVLTLAFMMALYSITQLLNANGAIAALVFGLILGNSKRISEILQTEDRATIYSRSGKEFYSQIAFFIKTFFFVYLGILINFSEPLSFVWALLILIGVFAVRPFAVWLSFKKGSNLKDVKLSETLIPKGLAAAVLVQLPIQAGLENAGSLVNIVLAVILLSIIASTIFVYLIQKDKYPGVYKFLYKKYR